MRTCVIILFFLTVNTFSQVWVSKFNGNSIGTNSAYKIETDNSGNIYVCGSTTRVGTGKDILVLKYNSSGVLVWSYITNGTSNLNDEARSICVDNGGNVFVSGFMNNSASGEDFCVVKLNQSGGQSWLKTYSSGGNNNDAGTQISIDANNNVVASGKIISQNLNLDFFTVKLTQDGNLIWSQSYNGPGNAYDEPFDILVDNQNNIYLAGLSWGIGTKRDAVVLKYNSAGNLLWQSRYDGESHGYDWATAMCQSFDGYIFITGNSWHWNNSYDYLTAKISPNGNLLWAETFDGGALLTDQSNDVCTDNLGNVYVTGRSWSTGYDITTLKYDGDGKLLWQQNFNGAGNSIDEGTSIAYRGSGIYVTGFARSSNQNYTEDYCTLQYNSDGDLVRSSLFDGTAHADDIASCLLINQSGKIIISGSTKENGNFYAVTTIMYDIVIGIQQISSEVPEKFLLGQNYPNPFNPNTKIRFAIPVGTGRDLSVQMKVYDVLGREVAVLVNEALKPGYYEVDFNGTNYSSGIYYYTLESDPETSSGFRETKKMILLK